MKGSCSQSQQNAETMKTLVNYCLGVTLIGTWWGLALLPLSADTFVPSTINSTTWTKAGSRYIVTANSVVPLGETLNIEPGVEVILAGGVYLNVRGRIHAIGGQDEPIVFRAASPSSRWDYITTDDRGPAANSIFRWCVFSNANAGLWLVAGRGETETQEVSNCVFQDCGTGIVGLSIGESTTIPLPSLDPLIQNCRFIDCTTNGIAFTLTRNGDGTPVDRPGRASPTIRNNTFRNIGEAAIAFDVERGGPSQPRVINNSLFNVQTGIRTQAPYDAIIRNNLFVSCETAIERLTVDGLNLLVTYNNFHDNGTNFVNYPSGFGAIVWENANGDPADITFNIFEDPQIADPDTLTIGPDSPCVDAGDQTSEYLDNCFPPSHGTTVNDIGAYGGPAACEWLHHSPTVLSLTIGQFFGVTITPIRPGTYRLEYAPTAGNTNNWLQVTNVNLLASPWTYFDAESPNEVSRLYRAILIE
jgi:hypothetical protein